MITLSDLPATLARADVIYAGTDYAGRVDMLILNDVTGNGYVYGKTTVEITDSEESSDGTEYNLTLTNSEGSVNSKYFPLNILKSNSFGGVVLSLDGTRVIAGVELSRIKNVSRSAFKTVDGQVILAADGISYPVADNVQCYNAAAGEWFDSLDDARRFSSVLTVYYDRDPAKGGKIRVVVAE